MRNDELNKLYPWTANAVPSHVAEYFTKEEWAIINKSDIPRLIKEKMFPEHFIIGLFESINLQKKALHLILSFENIVKLQIQVMHQVNSTSTNQNMMAVAEWFDDSLVRRFVRSNDDMDNLVQLLSSEKTRAQLAGDKAALAELSPIPLCLKKYAGQDLRDLLRNNKLSFPEFMNIARTLYKHINRVFPAWVGTNLELQGVANYFSDEQLLVLGRLMVPGILNNSELKIGLLQTLLATSKLNGMERIGSCMGISFERFVLTIQQRFLYNYTLMPPAAGAIKTFFNANGENTNDGLIRFYLKAYAKAETPLPIDPAEKTKLFEATLRNAAHNGNFWDVLILIHEVANINAPSKDGKTALHYAAIHAAKSGDRLCFDLLAAQEGIDFTLMDNDQKTAIAYWDFVKLPDDTLLNRLRRPAAAEQLPRPNLP